MPIDLPFSGQFDTDDEIFSVKNTLLDGQSDKDTSRVSAMTGNGGIVHGVHGINDGGNGQTPDLGVGVWGESNNGYGVVGASVAADGVRGVSRRNGVHGISDGPADSGVWGEHRGGGHGVSGSTSAGGDRAGVWGHNAGNGYGVKGSSAEGVGVYGESLTGGTAAYFKGNVVVTGDITLPNADLAEEFSLADGALVEPGTVLILGDDESVSESTIAYDTRVAGIASGAGPYRPAIVLNRRDEDAGGRAAIALVGRAYCKVDATFGAIRPGDLLVTSPTRGHAMKAADATRAFGSVLGKALRALSNGRGMIPVLITLQ